MKTALRWLLLSLCALVFQQNNSAITPQQTGAISGSRRRSSGFSPIDITGLKFWAIGDDAPTGAVATWTDESGNGKDATQAVSIMRPNKVSSSLNGHAILRFVATNATLLNTADLGVSQPLTICVVIKCSSATIVTQQAPLTGASSFSGLFLTTSSKWAMYGGSSAIEGSAIDTNAHLLIIILNGASSVMYLDGASNATGSPGVSGIAAFGIGGLVNIASQSFDGDLGEVAVYSGAFTGGNIASWTSYSQSKYSTP